MGSVVERLVKQVINGFVNHEFRKTERPRPIESPEMRSERKRQKRIEKLQRAVEAEERREIERYEQLVRQRTNVRHGFASQNFNRRKTY